MTISFNNFERESGNLTPIPNNTFLANISGAALVPSATTFSDFIDSAVSSVQGSVLYRSGTAWVALAPGSAGQILMTGGANENPQWATPSFTGPNVVIVTGANQTLVTNTIYILASNSSMHLTLPATAEIGSEIKIIAKGVGAWSVFTQTGQTIYAGRAQSSTGTGGYLASTGVGQCLTLSCITADIDFRATNMVGNLHIN